MNLEEAKTTIRDDSVGSIGWAMAAGTIVEETEERERLSPDTLKLLLICLSRGALAVSTATCALYGWTQRPWPTNINNNSHDPKEWEQYLKEHGFLP